MLGASGSGKSTLALALAGLIPREFAGDWTGQVIVDGRDSATVAPAALASRVGVVFQDPDSQLVMDRAEDDVAFGLENLAWPLEAMRRRVPEALSEVGLLGLARRRSVHLSGGEQQRLALAGVLAPGPGVLVLDEPTANLDPGGAAAFVERLGRIRAERSATVVLIEHRVDDVWPLADRVLVIGRDGRPVDLGAPDEVVRRQGARLVQEGIWLPVAIERALRGAVGETAPGSAVRETRESAAAIAATAGAASPAPTLTANAAPLAEVRAAGFAYQRGVRVLDGVDLDLAPGERAALVGPNGSGKSTLARLLVGLLRPDRGLVRLGGADPARLRAADLARQAGYVFQDPEQQFLTDRVIDELALGLRPAERDLVPALAATLDLPLEQFAERSPYTLSGGEQRRLSLACTLVRRPRLLVLDEPTFGQDRSGYEGLLAILRQRVEAGTCVIAATHDRRFVTDFARRVIVLERGRVVAGGPAATVTPAIAGPPASAAEPTAPGRAG